jgi:hypothetical protein
MRVFGWLMLLVTIGGCARTLRQTGLAQPAPEQLLGEASFQWQPRKTAGVDVYFQQGAAVTQSEDMPAAIAEMRREVSDTLHLSDHQPVHVFIVKSMEDMHRLLGHRVPGRSYYGTRVLALVADENWRVTARHELVHVIAGTAWGGSERWLSEGLATYLANPWYGRDVHRLAREQLLQTNQWIALEKLRGDFSKYPDHQSYLAAASAVKFIHEMYGAEVLKAVWQRPDALPAVTQKSWVALNQQWMQAVR